MARWKGGWKDKRKGRGRERGTERDGRVGEREESNRLALEIQLQFRIEKESC